jgi:hypothetical protein
MHPGNQGLAVCGIQRQVVLGLFHHASFATEPPHGHATQQESDETGVPVAYDLVKPSELKPSVGDDGVRCALCGRGLQTKTVLAQEHLAASASLE